MVFVIAKPENIEALSSFWHDSEALLRVVWKTTDYIVNQYFVASYLVRGLKSL